MEEHSGLTRYNLTNPEWHASHPSAAKHLFGFATWHETVMHVWALWPHLEPPTTLCSPSSPITPFEKCLLTKVRFRRALPHALLSFMFGRHPSRVSLYIAEWAPKWGEAGEDLSILDITPEYLEATCPQKYKDEGLHNVRTCSTSTPPPPLTHTVILLPL